MANDHAIADLDLTATVARKLGDLAIRGVRQLYARLRHEGPGLQHYLQLSDPAFAELCRRVEDAIRADYPEDLDPQVHPTVNKTGVAVDRLRGSNPPKEE